MLSGVAIESKLAFVCLLLAVAIDNVSRRGIGHLFATIKLEFGFFFSFRIQNVSFILRQFICIFLVAQSLSSVASTKRSMNPKRGLIENGRNASVWKAFEM